MNLDINRWLDSSEKVQTTDLDWESASRVGLTDDEVYVLTYFSDIEGQTIVYLRDMLDTDGALMPDNIAFLSMWNYEEYFHGAALARLLTVCGHPLASHRAQIVRRRARIGERLEAMGAKLLSWFFRREFPALYMAWGAVQELTTLKGYERLAKTTANPVLRVLCERIAKQERRHFAWYFNSARERLDASPRARWLTHRVLRGFWTPVGAGTKPAGDVLDLFARLFPGGEGDALAAQVDAKIATLPGLQKLSVMQDYFGRKREAMTARATPPAAQAPAVPAPAPMRRRASSLEVPSLAELSANDRAA